MILSNPSVRNQSKVDILNDKNNTSKIFDKDIYNSIQDQIEIRVKSGNKSKGVSPKTRYQQKEKKKKIIINKPYKKLQLNKNALGTKAATSATSYISLIRGKRERGNHKRNWQIIITVKN